MNTSKKEQTRKPECSREPSASKVTLAMVQRACWRGDSSLSIGVLSHRTAMSHQSACLQPCPVGIIRSLNQGRIVLIYGARHADQTVLRERRIDPRAAQVKMMIAARKRTQSCIDSMSAGGLWGARGQPNSRQAFGWKVIEGVGCTGLLESLASITVQPNAYNARASQAASESVQPRGAFQKEPLRRAYGCK